MAILTKDLEVTLRSRAAFILVEYLSNERTKKLALKKLDKQQVLAIQAEYKKKGQPAKALEIMLEKML